VNILVEKLNKYKKDEQERTGEKKVLMQKGLPIYDEYL